MDTLLGWLQQALELGRQLLVRLLGYVAYLPRPYPLDLTDFRGPSSLLGNRTVLFTVIIVHLLFFVFAYYCAYWDRVDYFINKRAIHINDIPAGTYKYLITIYTNWRPTAGTNGRVYLQLHGRFGRNSICYYLHNPYEPYRKLFGWGDISWFLVNTANPLGDILALTVALDNFGRSHTWFLSKVLVKDLQTNQSYRFPAHCWLFRKERSAWSADQSRVRLEPVDPSYQEPFGERMFEWVRRYIRERPLFGYCFLNLISNLSRMRMLAITYFYIHFVMLLNLMYFSRRQIGYFEWLFNISIKCIVSLLVQLLLRHLFGQRFFITRYPTQRQFNVRVAAVTVFGVLSLLQVAGILLYSMKYKDDRQSTHRWLYDFGIGLLQSELGYSHVFTFLRAYVNALFEIDPFAEEEAKVQLTSRVSVYRKFGKLANVAS